MLIVIVHALSLRLSLYINIFLIGLIMLLSIIVPLSTDIIIVSCSVYIHVVVSSFIPLFINGVLKHNYAHKDE
jgi:hypothetical protein